MTKQVEEKVKRFSKLTLFILVLGVVCVAISYPNIAQEHDGLVRHHPLKGLLLGIGVICFALYDLITSYIKYRKQQV